MQDEQEQQQEQQQPLPEPQQTSEAPPQEETAPPPPKVRKKEGEYDPAQCQTVAPGGTCTNCDWEWGMADPHSVHVMPQNVSAPAEGTVAPPEPPPKPEPDPKACPPVPLQGQCPKCEWTAATGNPHPVL
jgi:hypothetical protein